MDDQEPDNKSVPNRRESDRIRLDSWKAIANHFNRSVRTVRRWEGVEGLPVHRHRHTKGSTVYAFKSELDAWRAGHQKSTDRLSDVAVEANSKNTNFRLARYAAVLTVAVLIGGGAYRYVFQAAPGELNDATWPQPQLDAAAYWPESVAEVYVAPIFSAWTEGRVEDALRESQAIVNRMRELPPEVREHVIDYLVVFSLNLGRIGDAKFLSAKLPDGSRRDALLARIAFASGDMHRVADVLKDGETSANLSMPQSDVFLAMAAKQSGDLAEAKVRLQAAVSELVVEDQGYFFVALDMLAGVLKSEGDLAGAIKTLERTMPERNAAARNRSGLFWLMCQRQLANLYREAGRSANADDLESELRNWLILADDDFPLAESLGGS